MRKFGFSHILKTTNSSVYTVIRGLSLRPKKYSTVYGKIRYRKTMKSHEEIRIFTHTKKTTKSSVYNVKSGLSLHQKNTAVYGEIRYRKTMKSHEEIRIFTHTKKRQSPVYILSYVDFPCVQRNTAQFMVIFEIGKLYETS
jgi:hypothetical protein